MVWMPFYILIYPLLVCCFRFIYDVPPKSNSSSKNMNYEYIPNTKLPGERNNSGGKLALSPLLFPFELFAIGMQLNECSRNK